MFHLDISASFEKAKTYFEFSALSHYYECPEPEPLEVMASRISLNMSQ